MFLCSGALLTGVWTRMNFISETQPRHQINLSNLICSLGRGNAPSTSRVYKAWFDKFERFCHQSGWVLSQIGTAEVALFLQELLSEGRASSSLSQAAAAISWHFQLADRADPVQHKIIRSILAASKRIAAPVRHKEPAKISHLRHLRLYAEKTDTFAAWRTFLISLTLFGSCSRLDDLIALRIMHIEVQDGFVQLTLPRSKTDQVRDSCLKFLSSCEDSSLCPVSNFRIWLARKELGHSAEDAIFLARWARARPISKSTYRDNLKTALKNGHLPSITSHSWRVGAASLALERCGNVEDVQHFGCWAAPRSMQPYIKKTRTRKIKTASLVWPQL